VTRQVVARHAEILEELGYWRDGAFRIYGKLIHLDVCSDVGTGEEGACEGGDEGMVNKPSRSSRYIHSLTQKWKRGL
jgi:hypothetical protein